MYGIDFSGLFKFGVVVGVAGALVLAGCGFWLARQLAPSGRERCAAFCVEQKHAGGELSFKPTGYVCECYRVERKKAKP